MLDVEHWGERRRKHVVRGVSIKELVCRHGIDRNTVVAVRRATGLPTGVRSIEAAAALAAYLMMGIGSRLRVRPGALSLARAPRLTLPVSCPSA